MKKLLCAMLCFLCFCIIGKAQENDELHDLINEIKGKREQPIDDNSAYKETRKIKEVGLNLTQTLSQFIPFNESLSRSGPFTLLFRSGRENKRFNLELGMRLKDDISFNNMTNYFNLAAGYLKKRELSEKFNYYVSYNAIINFGSFNQPNEAFTDSGGIGFGLGFGIEYKLSDHVKLVTESMLTVTSSDFGLNINTIPPIGLFLVVDFYKN